MLHRKAQVLWPIMHVTCDQATASISAVGALYRLLLRPRRVLCCLIYAECLDVTGCGVMRVWCLGVLQRNAMVRVLQRDAMVRNA